MCAPFYRELFTRMLKCSSRVLAVLTVSGAQAEYKSVHAGLSARLQYLMD
jgi:hypothetical protein